METLSLLAKGAWYTSRVTASVLIRKIASEQPTLLLDESDTAFQGTREYSEALRGILDGGWRRGNVASLSVPVGRDWRPRDFPVFCPKAIAGIGNLPGTVQDRGIDIVLKRRAASEPVRRFRRRDADALAAPLKELLEKWGEAHLEALMDARPSIPDELDDRAADCWEPLLAIADALGGDWPRRARDAAISLSASRGQEDFSPAVRLLFDIWSIFEEKGVPSLPSTDLLSELRMIEDAPWATWRGKGLDSYGLATFLKPFGVHHRKLRVGKRTPWGYEKADFLDAWRRYPPQGGTSGTHGTTAPAHPMSLVPTVPDVPDAAGAGGNCVACGSGAGDVLPGAVAGGLCSPSVDE